MEIKPRVLANGLSWIGLDWIGLDWRRKVCEQKRKIKDDA